MSDNTSIEWATASWNPLRGVNARHTCARISPGCNNCYAATMTRRGLMGTAPIDYGIGEAPNDPSRLDEVALLQPSRWKKPRRIFVCSMTDLFGTWVQDEWLDRIYLEMANAPQHTYLVLTKRPSRMLTWHQTTAVHRSGLNPGDYLSNVWAGVTIESDAYAWRANVLRNVPAAIRWVSAEPLLSGLPSLDLTGIDWVVAGGESGPGARPMHPAWSRDLRDRCIHDGIAYFFKQHGEWQGVDQSDAMLRSGTREHVWSDGTIAHRVGNKAAGRLLDGREWNEYPVNAAAPSLSGEAGQ